MNRRMVLSLMVLALSCWAAGEGPTAHPVVRTQMVKSTQLAPDPRNGGQVGTFAGPGWMAFDKHGYLSEIGSAVDGVPANVEHRKLDARGRAIESTNDGGPASRVEYKDGPFGALEEYQYSGDRLARKTVNQYDARGRCLSTETSDGDGNRLSSVQYQYDAQGHNTQIITQSWAAGEAAAQRYYRQDDTYAADGSLRERVEFDRNGEALRSITFNSDFQDVSWWQKPGVVFPQPLYAGKFDPQTSVNTNYELTPDGRLFKTLETHDKSADVDAVERYDDSGNLVEKVTFRYERDRAGNWTKRTVSAWDPKTGGMVDIQEDTRTLTYY